MLPALTKLIVILLILGLIYIFYMSTLEQVDLVIPCQQKDENNIIQKRDEGDFKVAFIANRGTNYLEARIINVMIAKGQYYVYSNKTAYHVEQLQNDNRVSLLIYTKQGESMKQTLLYGELESVKDTPNLILYKLNIDARKIAITVDTCESRSTSYSFNGNDQKHLVTDFTELNALISHLSIQ